MTLTEARRLGIRRVTRPHWPDGSYLCLIDTDYGPMAEAIRAVALAVPWLPIKGRYGTCYPEENLSGWDDLVPYGGPVHDGYQFGA